MANTEIKDNVVDLENNKIPENPNPDEGKNEEPKKEFWLISGAKAAGRGLKKVGHAINEGVHKHPYIAATITTAIGYGIRVAVDLISGNSSDTSDVEVPTLELPEPDDYVEIEEEEPIEVELPEIETTTEE